MYDVEGERKGGVLGSSEWSGVFLGLSVSLRGPLSPLGVGVHVAEEVAGNLCITPKV